MDFSLKDTRIWAGLRGLFGNAKLTEKKGVQQTGGLGLTTSVNYVGVDGALNISTVWSCVDKRANIIATLPFFTYDNRGGKRTLARGTRLYELLHNSPNSRMTSAEFWRAMMLNYDLRGRAYARIDRAEDGEAVAMWPMPADQVVSIVLDDGSMAYKYTIDGNVAILSDKNVLHLKNLGNGTEGISKLECMAASLSEATNAQKVANDTFANGGKVSGVLMVDQLLTEAQRDKIKSNFADMACGGTSTLKVLEANMKFQQLAMTPEQQQLLSTRQNSVEDLCRWLDMPPVLAYHSNMTTWGSGIEQIINGWHTLSIRPLMIFIEQAVRKSVLTAQQRQRYTCEFSYDALLRGDPDKRSQIIARQVQNGLKNRDEGRQLENDPPYDGGNIFTVQSNLVPVNLLGAVNSGKINTVNQPEIAQ